MNVTGHSTMVSSIHSTAVFGPVPSRRLGRSLGVDLVPFKTCSYDCVDCETVSQLLRRRPCTFEDLAEGLAAHPAAILKCLDRLIAHKQIQTTRLGDRFYYCAEEQP